MNKFFTLLCIAGLFSSCGGNGSSTSVAVDSAKTDTATKQAGTAEKPVSSAGKWDYSEKEDKMTSGKKYFASIDSDNKLDFEFPYDGGSTATILVRNQDKQNEAMLSISKGQFVVGVDGGEVKVRFDAKKAMTFACSEPSDGTSDLIFIENSKKFIKELKGAKKVVVQAEFYQSGLKEMEFSTEGFKWTH